MPNRPVAALDINILLGLAKLDVLDCNTMLLSVSLMYSGPLSTLIVSGLQRHSMILSRLRTTRSAGSEKSVDCH